MREPKLMATTYYYGSETSYAFGPFSGEKAAEEWAEKNDDADKHNGFDFRWINDPAAYGTGQEVA